MQKMTISDLKFIRGQQNDKIKIIEQSIRNENISFRPANDLPPNPLLADDDKKYRDGTFANFIKGDKSKLRLVSAL